MKRLSGKTKIDMIQVSAASAGQVQEAQNQIDAVLRQRHRIPPNGDADFQMRSQEEIAQAQAAQSMGILRMLLLVIAAISLLVGGIGIMNIMLVSVTERTREIGIRMAIGAKGRHVLLQFLFEAVTLAIVGGALGIALGVGASLAVKHFLQWPIVVTPASVALSFGVAAFVGIFFGFYPARKAARLDPIDALALRASWKASRNSMPLSMGIMRSSRMTVYSVARVMFSASAPFTAACTSNGSRRSAATSSARMASSSSTTRIFGTGGITRSACIADSEPARFRRLGPVVAAVNVVVAFEKAPPEARQLLTVPIRELGLRLEQSPVAEYVHRLYAELEAAGLHHFRPLCYLTDQWGCPSEEPVIGIPFYLGDPRVAHIEDAVNDVENEREIMMYLRHEAGHAFNYAYELYRTDEWHELFGSFRRRYRDDYPFVPFSRDYVRHIAGWYAQKHPDEDFAETFAVWLDPESHWRRRYANWGAMRKLLYIDRLAREVSDMPPPHVTGQTDVTVDEMEQTVEQFYRDDQPDESAMIAGLALDTDLTDIFLDPSRRRDDGRRLSVRRRAAGRASPRHHRQGQRMDGRPPHAGTRARHRRRTASPRSRPPGAARPEPLPDDRADRLHHHAVDDFSHRKASPSP